MTPFAAGGGVDPCPWWLVVANVVVPMRVCVTSSRFTVTSLTKRGDSSGALQRDSGSPPMTVAGGEGGCVTSSPMAKHTSSIKRIRDQERDIIGDQRSLDGGGGCLERKKMIHIYY
ncbi:LOW QUALITY PROTEIN: hypothetical protein HID58_061101 [Brassica napus]|uniref:Secreted protein n=1 Tax=Brassica napus TaxID=3708 RepID=A0ABQ7ZXN1_BRANA|nr:LOW QUALITY PROTEIN: hypothetical protein HID58_061101 [Brassica napus]